jgi:hypothetical protein
MAFVCPAKTITTQPRGGNRVDSEAKEIAMKFTPYLIAVALVGSVAACEPYYGDGYRYDRNPNYAYAPGYTYYPPNSSSGYYYPRNYSRDHYYTSRWDYYRNYNGISPPSERYP